MCHNFYKDGNLLFQAIYIYRRSSFRRYLGFRLQVLKLLWKFSEFASLTTSMKKISKLGKCDFLIQFKNFCDQIGFQIFKLFFKLSEFIYCLLLRLGLQYSFSCKFNFKERLLISGHSNIIIYFYVKHNIVYFFCPSIR